LLDRLKSHKNAFALHETTSAARPYLLAGIYRALRAPMLVIVPTADVAERTFADLMYYVGDDAGDGRTIALVRPREESVGVIESPSERSARMTLFADLAAGKPLIAIAPVAALRQYVMPRALFAESSFTVVKGDEPGFEEIQERLFDLGYHRAESRSTARS